MKRYKQNASFSRILFMIMSSSVAILLVLGGCSRNTPINNCETYAEAVDPAPDPSADWTAVEPGLHASVGSINQHYFKSSIPQVAKKNIWNGTAWKGEKVSSQLVLWSRNPVQHMECEFSR